MSDKDKGKARSERSKIDNIDKFMQMMDAKFGTNSLIRYGDNTTRMDIIAIPTGVSSFDHATGVGGIPRGRVTEFSGPEAAGKTLLALRAIATAQTMGGRGGFTDAEHALTPSFGELVGVDMDDLYIAQPDSAEQSFDITIEMASSGLFDVVVHDSVVALATEAEIEGNEGIRGQLAQVLSTKLRKLVSMIHPNTAVICINQIREKPDAKGMQKKTYTPGGRALKHYASLRVEITKLQTYIKGNTKVGHRAKAYINKNKVAPPFKFAEFDIDYTSGIDYIADMVDTAIRVGIIQQNSSWFYIGDVKTLGRTALMEAVKEDMGLAAMIQAEMKKANLIRGDGLIENDGRTIDIETGEVSGGNIDGDQAQQDYNQ